jgi:hypothetical protein
LRQRALGERCGRGLWEHALDRIWSCTDESNARRGSRRLDRLGRLVEHVAVLCTADDIEPSSARFRSSPTNEVLAQTLPSLVDRIARRVDGAPVYLSFDLDLVSPGHGPGVQTPDKGTARATVGAEIMAVRAVQS